MKALKINKNKLAILISLACATFHVAADDAVEFNTDVLDASDRQNVDLQRFSEGNFVAPGTYLLDVRINGQEIPQQQITYIADPQNAHKTLVCFTPQQLALLALKDEVQPHIRTIAPDCLDISGIDGIRFSNAAGVLDITIPQAWMKYSDPDWTPPERWDNGVNGAIFDYNLSGQATHYLKEGGHYQTLSGYGQTGFNVGAWRFRSQYQMNYGSGGQSARFDWDQFYAYRPLPMHEAKLTVGEIYLDSQVFDSVRFTGVNLASDERMLPPSLQGYAPQVHGIAKSNAKVTISQQGRVIYQTTVPAGPFNIEDLRSSVRGQLDVRVEEQDGSVQTFQVSTADIPYLTRPGYVRYNNAFGRPSRYSHDIEGPAFYSGDFSWGISNAWSLYGGAFIAGSRYNAGSLGVGRDLSWFGAVSADVTQTMSRVKDESRQQGRSFKLSYAKTFDDYHSTISFAGYRFSQRSYRTFAQFLEEQYDNDDSDGRERQMYTVAANKTFFADEPRLATTLYLTFTHQNYWDQQSQNRYGLSVGHSFTVAGIGGISTNLAAYRSEYQGSTDDSVSLSVSIPWGDGRSVEYQMQNNGDRTSQMASYSDNRDSNNSWRLRAGASEEGHGAFDGYYKHRSSMAELESNVNWEQERYVSVGGTVRGGFTATRHGAALHNSQASMNTARVMVDTDGVADVPLNGQLAHSNRFGIAVVPDIVSYHSFDTRIDVDAMDEDIAATKAIATSTLTEGAIGYQHFAVARGGKMMVLLRMDNGSVPPFGSEVLNSSGVNVGMVMDDGEAWLEGVKPEEMLSLSWNGSRQCQVRTPKTVNTQGKVLLLCQPLPQTK
ncbi:fimbria/pilus outer membrane usher protein [Pluralibacter gergoviae]|uniref:Fimbria/pilus outer membrane usher protein n=1 Tax=Pluralibacter gergoviae TaxID=61647 RepID=A0AAI9DN34_PLUGE|nr:fimbria/pilus outer membrane usher protein [Pluralibacter gergoviae]EKV0916945.1 fimbria/pilus outer membrane usher protein [Pluralibacter gergoviae]EKV9910593.1 fimbria/pilus outer membrane usher protein [Pluralibacter gergoviae]EKW7276565.1 fimbria/pilus outer membrane usher protein [Pluralibacter gergoviae]ELD4296235.1 fimbria/pilus outer membrane usher protein [Pluralibacter gergoviae]ELD4306736.1 fimbria/pilus outer membrane usher protein [Pluralibacter gergoviae]